MPSDQPDSAVEHLVSVYEERHNDTRDEFAEWLSVLTDSVVSGREPEGAAARIALNATKHTQTDLLGALYQRLGLQDGGLGQTWTPQLAVDIILSRTLLSGDPPENGERVLDPACGSGRFLLGACRAAPQCSVVGVDKDPLCARMALCSLSAVDATGYVVEGDALIGECEHVWRLQNGVVEQPPIRVGERLLDADAKEVIAVA